MGASELFPASFFQALGRLPPPRPWRGPGLAEERRRGGGQPGTEHRPGQPGDPPRLVDWRATARRGRPWVRLREAERGGELLLVLDRSASLSPGTAVRDRDQRRLALALGWRALEGGAAVWLAAGPGPWRRFQGPGRRGALRSALEALAEPAARDAELLPPPPPRRRGTRRSVLLTDPWAGPAWEDWMERLRRADPGTGARLWVVLVLPREEDPPHELLALRPCEEEAPGFAADPGADPAAWRRSWRAFREGGRRRRDARGLLELELGLHGDAAGLLRRAREAGLV